MFEVPEDKEEVKRGHWWIGVTVVVFLVLVGILLFTTSRHSAKGPASPGASVAAAPQAGPNPVHDLKVLNVKMDKDRLGTTAVWSVTIENNSGVYTYSDIHYETTYVGADNSALLVNQGAIQMTLGPSQERNSEIRDALYPNGTAWYKFRITEARSAVQ